jgi:hypothetical protein
MHQVPRRPVLGQPFIDGGDLELIVVLAMQGISVSRIRQVTHGLQPQVFIWGRTAIALGGLECLSRPLETRRQGLLEQV